MTRRPSSIPVVTLEIQIPEADRGRPIEFTTAAGEAMGSVEAMDRLVRFASRALGEPPPSYLQASMLRWEHVAPWGWTGGRRLAPEDRARLSAVAAAGREVRVLAAINPPIDPEVVRCQRPRSRDQELLLAALDELGVLRVPVVWNGRRWSAGVDSVGARRGLSEWVAECGLAAIARYVPASRVLEVADAVAPTGADCAECEHTECGCPCATCVAAAARPARAPCMCLDCRRASREVQAGREPRRRGACAGCGAILGHLGGTSYSALIYGVAHPQAVSVLVCGEPCSIPALRSAAARHGGRLLPGCEPTF
jgi:hypothetical protein